MPDHQYLLRTLRRPIYVPDFRRCVPDSECARWDKPAPTVLPWNRKRENSQVIQYFLRLWVDRGMPDCPDQAAGLQRTQHNLRDSAFPLGTMVRTLSALTIS